MKNIIKLLVPLIILFCLVACDGNANTYDNNEPSTAQCNHVWGEATCKEYAKCKLCDKEKIGFGEHDYSKATCKAPSTCKICGETTGDTLPHTFSRGNCMYRGRCSKCGAEGDFGEHYFSGGTCITKPVCIYCKSEGEYKKHAYVGQTCTEQGVCKICSDTIDAVGHNLIHATCTMPIFCTRCDYTDGEALGHEGQGKCKRCGIATPIQGSGYGDAVISDINFAEDGIHLLHFTHTGRGNIIVHGYDETGDKDHLINEIGNYDGVVVLWGNSPYMFNIKADGQWTYEITKIETTSEKSFSGKGDYVTGIFSTSSGAQIWHFTHDGESNFIVRVVTTDGSRSVVNEIGIYDADQIINIPAGSNAFFEIIADGNWEIYPG